jgi:hypothetical protein
VISFKVRSYFRTPKGLLLLLLAALMAVAYPVDGRQALPRLGLAIGSAVIVDVLFMRRRAGWSCPTAPSSPGSSWPWC